VTFSPWSATHIHKPLKTGQKLSHYRLVEKIGEGGMGVVWKAVGTTLDREVAIKVLPEALASRSPSAGEIPARGQAAGLWDGH
jgi:serine/threonine protein kinase